MMSWHLFWRTVEQIEPNGEANNFLSEIGSTLGPTVSGVDRNAEFRTTRGA